MDAHANCDPPIACNLLALEPDIRAAHMESAALLLGSAAEEVAELSDGYAFRFQSDQYDQIAQFIANERRCCPFFSFTLEVSPAQGPVWLRIMGGEGVKDFIQSELNQRGCA